VVLKGAASALKLFSAVVGSLAGVKSEKKRISLTCLSSCRNSSSCVNFAVALRMRQCDALTFATQDRNAETEKARNMR
jgi:hypothetical protein